jgi:ADP-dependent NAD(P)H-hydrate dehydratase / NAD(P)H-hydrate epimerase
MSRMQRILPVSSEIALFDVASNRAMEQRAASSLPPFALMARAGAATARLALALAPHAQRIWIAAGPGNNGGDGREAASQLQRLGKRVTVSLIGDSTTLPADAKTALAHATASGVTFAAQPPPSPDLAIDALLGIGANRAPHGAMETAILVLNALPCPVLAIDLPSGLQADTGRLLGESCVRASHTLTMLALKPGLFTALGRDRAGTVWLDDLGVDSTPHAPQAWLSGTTTPPARHHAQHKGSFGDVAIVGGSAGMGGAALLAARSAHAAGAGRVFVELLDHGQATYDSLRPELMFRQGWTTYSPVAALHASTVVCGCGGGEAVRGLLPRLLSLAGRLVLDADALNAMSADTALMTLTRSRIGRGQATILTPHPLEAARLLGRSTGEVQADRLTAAHEIATRYRTVVVLKGSGSVIAAPGQVARINSTGNAALASAGTGDVLAGWLGGRWAQAGSGAGHGGEMSAAFSAAIHGVAEHGAAAEPQPSGPLRAGDLIERLYRR